MIKFITVLSLILTGIFATAQTAIKKTELPSHITLIPVQSNGIKMFAKKYRAACLAFNKNTKELMLYGEVNDEEIIFLEKIKHQLIFYPENLVRCNYSPDKGIELCSSVSGKTEIICGIFNWKNESAFFEKEERSDISPGIKQRAEKLLQMQKPREAMLTYDSLTYPDAYINTEEVAVKLLQSARMKAQEESGKRKFKEAAAYIQTVLTYRGWGWLEKIKTETELKSRFGKELHGLKSEDFSEILAEYLQYNNDARQYDQTIASITTYIRWYPQKAVWWLLLGDAYYGKKDKEKAKEYYNQYVIKMKELKKEKQIPDYIEQRLR
jgi:tetratricopeptide (TPR) repeat protein